MASADFEVGPSRKKRKISAPSDDIFRWFFTECDEFDDFLGDYKNVLVGFENSLIPAVIQSCDAGGTQPNRWNGIPFQQCHCAIEEDPTQQFYFGTLFVSGTEIYNNLKERMIPEDGPLKMAARKLLEFCFSEKEWHEEMTVLEEENYVEDKTQLTITLAEHFFNRLSLSDGYEMDKYLKKAKSCKCGKCKVKDLHFDDTSIGNRSVWHGNVDVLFESCNIAICQPECKDDGDKSPGGRSSMEIKAYDINHIQSRSRVVAQAIVFAFVQKRRHPYWKHFLLPTIIANNNAFKVFFYDPKNDLLLVSRSYQFFSRPESLNYMTVITAWHVLNHKLLCSGPYPELLNLAPKSKFKQLLDSDVLNIYEKEVYLKNVLERGCPEKLAKPCGDATWFEYLRMHNTSWPESIPLPT